MRVLYILAHFPQNSESYVDAEISYFLKHGVEIEVWSPTAGYGDTPRVPVRRGALKEALDGFRPDVVHVHHMTTASYYVDQLPKGRVTVRAHSFDWDEGLAGRLVRHPSVRRVFAFPHFADMVPGVVPLPVAYDPSLYFRSEKDRRRVVRLAAGLPTKRLEDFLVIGNRLHGDAEFTLAVNLVIGKESLVDGLASRNLKLGGHVKILANLSRAAARDLIAGAGIYLGTYDAASHPFGMPISIAESLATGSFVVVRNADGVGRYMGEAMLAYESVEAAEDFVRLAVSSFSDEEWRFVEETAVAAAAPFRSDVVLPRLEKEWREICSDNF